MSVEIYDAVRDRQLDYELAMHTMNAEKMYRLACLDEKEGNHEDAMEKLALIKKWDNEDWAHDRAVDNEL